MAKTRRPTFLEGWLASIPRAAVLHLGLFRECHDVQVCDHEEAFLWLRGSHLQESIHRALRSLLGCEVFRQLDDGQLVPINGTITCGYRPQGTWKPLREWLETSLPAKRFPATTEPFVPISLVRSELPQEPGVLKSSLQAWAQYASEAPQIRLACLQFAASRDQVVIVGKPLPPLIGEYFYLQEGIAVPIGFAWTPKLDAGVLRMALELQSDDIAIFLLTGDVSKILGTQFVGATRSAVRLTMEAIHAGS